jgi:preprotein translocase subunit SecF
MARQTRTRPRTTVPLEGAGLRRHLHVEFVRSYKTWFTISGLILLVSAASLVFRGLDLSIDFIGGSSFTLSGVEQEITDEELEDAASEAGAEQARAQIVREGDQVIGAIVVTDAIDPGSPREVAVRDALTAVAGPPAIDITFVGPTWGDHISRTMLQALVVFLVIAVGYISIRLEFKMSIAALIALTHDVLLAAGVYALFGFTVSPATIIAFLTVLGYSMYDTVVVFDRVQENTASLGGPGRRSYGQAVNTAMNDVLWRSVNTTLSSTLPVAGLLFIGSQLLGATTLFDLALALFVGMIAGAYSSLFLAGPILALWKERDPRLATLARHAEIKEREEAEEEPDEEPEEVAEVVAPASDDAPVATEDGPPPTEAPRESKAERAARRRAARGPVQGPGKKPRRKRR